MTAKLDRVRSVREGYAFAAVVTCMVEGAEHRGGITCHGSKRPVAVLFMKSDKIYGLDLDGSCISETALEARFPGLNRQFRQRVTQSEL